MFTNFYYNLAGFRLYKEKYNIAHACCKLYFVGVLESFATPLNKQITSPRDLLN